MKILSLVGARPQFIKEAVIYQELKNTNVQEMLVHSGQHYDFNMSDVFFEVLEIKRPEYFLNIGSGTHGEMTGKIMIEFEKVVLKEKPDVILVYGDTNTTLAGAIVGAKLKIPVAHIEAGIRQEPKDMPEEINRVLTDHVSKYLFCPTQISVENLKRENITNGVYFVGDVMYDLYKMMEPRFKYEVFESLKLKPKEYIVMTLHRDFNVDNPQRLEKIFKVISKISKKIDVVFPIHPRTKKRVQEFGLVEYLRGVKVTDPVDYLNLMGLVKNCFKVITDSGGLQKEAYFAKKQAIVLMPDTGWRELTECGWNQLLDISQIEEKLEQVTFDQKQVIYPTGIYGDGKAGKKIVQVLISGAYLGVITTNG